MSRNMKKLIIKVFVYTESYTRITPLNKFKNFPKIATKNNY